MSGLNEAQGYAASLRQQAAWIDSSRYTEDLDADELRAAAAFIERAMPQGEPVALATTLEHWAEALRTPTIAEHTVSDLAMFNGRCITEDLEDAAKALRASPSLPVSEPGGWQPIETAPKDGTEIISTYFDGDEGGSHWIIFWNGAFFEDACGGFSVDHATHWQPLPAPPQTLNDCEAQS